MKSKVYFEDLSNVSKFIAKSNFANTSILITGATGLIGSFLVESFLQSNTSFNTNIKVYALIRNRQKANEIFSDYLARKDLVFIEADINTTLDIKIEVNYIIHTASITSSKEMVATPVEVIKTLINGTVNIFDFAKANEVKSTVYLSSLEVYGVVDSSANTIKESDLGYIDILNIRSSYSEGKRLAECLCASYASQYNLKIPIARLTQTFGSNLAADDNRIFALLARSVVNNEDIVLHTKGLLSRCYCYLTDAAKAIILLLKEGVSGEAYNIANEDTFISIRDMAEMVCTDIANNKIKVVYDIPEDIAKLGYSPTTKIKLNCDKIYTLGWHPEYNLKEMYTRLINSLHETKQ